MGQCWLACFSTVFYSESWSCKRSCTSRPPNLDPLVVFYLIIAETVNTCCDMYLIYQPLVQEYNTSAAVTYFPMMLAASPIVTVCVSTPVQIFTAWRISVVSQRKIMAIIISLCALLSFVGAFWVGVEVVTFKLFSQKASFRFNLPAVIWFTASVAADLLITVTLVLSLSARRTGYMFTNVSINRIIRMTIQTGLTTLLFAIADLLSFTISPQTAENFVWDFSISKLYTNALLSTLNARVGWGNLTSGDRDPENVLFGDSTTQTGSYPSRNSTSNAGARRRNITTSTASETVGSYELQPSSFRGDVHINIVKHTISDYTPELHDNAVQGYTQ
ncbi:hypothetical protein SERLA73DRAFT_191884 [Serpula lacrymans var. lacrymans S7.3]|uniref:DUF6534 domain-containing protein n=1 Tax=Serpula lacrymans var. lacrymans (strain S7.3) TaxID=936435 RepID=F8QII4_SERL3|nr:hypothetical protein SERLA73DRAFT_191884 [Serpula lacrymans var. lacrymans S7.3]